MTLVRNWTRHTVVGFVIAVLVVGCEKTTSPGGNNNNNSAVPTTVTLDKTSLSFDAVGATDQLTATVKDQNGSTMTGVTISWSTDAAGVATVNTSGLVTSVGNGSATIKATAGTAMGTATVDVAQVATKLIRVSGDSQAAPPSATLPQPVVVEVDDRLDAPVQGVTVDFAAAAGSGSVNPTSASTGVDGRASTTWTLGGTDGADTVTATSGSLTGSPLNFTAKATSLFIASVTPDTIVEGSNAVLHGQGFSPTPASNTVSVAGVSASVVSSTDSTVTFTVPTSSCQPAQDVSVQVTVAAVNSNSVTQPRQPAQFVSLAVGQQQIIQDPNNFCLQFRGTISADEYVIGVGAAAELPNATLIHQLTGVGGAPFPSAPRIPSALSAPRTIARSAGVRPDPELAQRWAQQRRAEARIRRWEEEHLNPRLNPGLRPMPMRSGPARAPVVPSVGDTIHFRVPDIDAGGCAGYADITTIVKRVGAAGVFVADTLNPVTDSLTDADIMAYSDSFDNYIYARDTLYFGAPSDIDNNGEKVYIVLTIEVNKFVAGAAGFVFSGDLYPRASCASSDTGEIFYSHVPDPNDIGGQGPRSKNSVLAQMASLIAHEFTHDIQQSRRLIVSGNLGAVNMARWEAEGQAVFAEEIVGMAALGDTPYQNYGSAKTGSTGGVQWYRPEFRSLAQYYGYQPIGSASDAPELCTLLAASNTSTPCNAYSFYGPSYTFHRFVADQFGPGVVSGMGGEIQLQRDWIYKDVTKAGVANVANLLGVQFDSLFDRWAAMLYVDDRVGGVDSTLTLLSWDMTAIMGSLGLNTLTPVDRTFTAFDLQREVRGGSTDYSRLSSVAGHGFFAIKLRDTGGGVLGTSMKPQFWIVRLQ